VGRLVPDRIHTSHVPPFLLAVTHYHLLAVPKQQSPEAPAAPYCDGLKLGHPNGSFLSVAGAHNAPELGELVQADVLKLGENINRPDKISACASLGPK
jgi:hypothetical protein